jgi:hypothetical protein
MALGPFVCVAGHKTGPHGFSKQHEASNAAFNGEPADP